MLVENICKICVFYFYVILSEVVIYFFVLVFVVVEGVIGKVRYKYRCFCEFMYGYI